MLKFKKIWAVDVEFKGQFIQITSFRYKVDAIKEAKKWSNTKVEKRELLTDKY
jgi:hypothetical protein